MRVLRCGSGRMCRCGCTRLGVGWTPRWRDDGAVQRVAGDVVPYLQRSSLGRRHGQLQHPLAFLIRWWCCGCSNYPYRRLTFLLSVRPSVCLSLCNVHELWSHIFSAINNYFQWSTTNFVKEKFWLGEFWLSIIASLAFSTLYSGAMISTPAFLVAPLLVQQPQTCSLETGEVLVFWRWVAIRDIMLGTHIFRNALCELTLFLLTYLEPDSGTNTLWPSHPLFAQLSNPGSVRCTAWAYIGVRLRHTLLQLKIFMKFAFVKFKVNNRLPVRLIYWKGWNSLMNLILRYFR